MKKLLALLAALLLAVLPASAENAPEFSEDEAAALVLKAICAFLDSEELIYETSMEYPMCSLSFDLEKTSALGSCIGMDAHAMYDGALIIAYYEQNVPEDRADEVLRLCNYLNAETYGAKLYLSPDDLGLYCETFLPLYAGSIGDEEMFLLSESFWLAYGFAEFYHDYFIEVIANGETAANAYAMWLADSE